MRIGKIHLTWDRSDQKGYILSYLKDDDHARQAVKKMARSEVKNYLAELAEESSRVFGSPVEFLSYLNRDLDLIMESHAQDEVR